MLLPRQPRPQCTCRPLVCDAKGCHDDAHHSRLDEQGRTLAMLCDVHAATFDRLTSQHNKFVAADWFRRLFH